MKDYEFQILSILINNNLLNTKQLEQISDRVVGAFLGHAVTTTTTLEVAVQAPAAAKELTPGVDVGTVTDATTLDKPGYPWDSRIHASTKTFNADGSWKYARGVDREVLVPQVEAELRAQGYGVQAQTPVSTPVAPLTAPTAAATPGLPPVGAPAAPSIPAIPQPPVTAKVDFPDMTGKTDITAEELEQTALALVDKHGIAVLKGLLTMFRVPEGGTIEDLPEADEKANWPFVFWQYASNDAALRQQSLIN